MPRSGLDMAVRGTASICGDIRRVEARDKKAPQSATEFLPSGRACLERSREISPSISMSFRLKNLIVTAPRSARSSASTFRKMSSKSLKHRTREEGAGKGEFAFTECRYFHLSLAQNRGFCAKEEPQAIKQTSQVYSACCGISLAATRRNLTGFFSDTIYP